MEIIPNVHLVPGIVANPYLILEPTGLTLIDAGLPGSHRKILRYMSGLGYAPRGLRRIIITHSDYDHIGGLAALKAATGARVFSSSTEAEAIAKGKASRPLKPTNFFARLVFGLMDGLFKARPAQVDENLSEGEVLPILGGLTVLDTFGHTPGHISLYAPSVGVLFCGDSIVSEKTGLRGSSGMNNWDQAAADASVRKQAALGAKVVCSGHGSVVMDAAEKFPQVKLQKLGNIVQRLRSLRQRQVKLPDVPHARVDLQPHRNTGSFGQCLHLDRILSQPLIFSGME
jgi:glyoxylase-like metal-dependent hydrolase (beta-lactamase superfamily II)